MAEITPFPTLQRIAVLEAKNADQAQEIVRLTRELHEARSEMSAAKGLNALTRMQLHDVLATVEAWRQGLTDVETNVRAMMARLPGDGQ